MRKTVRKEMMTPNLFLPLRAALLLAAMTIAPAFADQPAPKGDAAHGKELFLKIGCFECHGRVGEGGGFLGPVPTLAHTSLPLDAFTMQLRQPANNMPAYVASVLPDTDVADLFAYVQSLPGPLAADALPEILKH